MHSVRRIAALALTAAAALGTVGTPSAHADVSVGGRTFHTTVSCGGSFMDVTTNTATDSGAYVMVYVYSYSTGQWTTDSRWYRADQWAGFFTPSIRTSYGYYSVYAYYASYTTSGWVVSGEPIRSYRQKSGYNAYGSGSCLMGV